MTLKYFRRLSEPHQYKRLLTKGVCIGERIYHDALLLLFQLDEFYVEITFHNDTDELMSTRSFDDIEQLDPYLEQIKIPHLL
jgi:hypothetical protein